MSDVLIAAAASEVTAVGACVYADSGLYTVVVTAGLAGALLRDSAVVQVSAAVAPAADTVVVLMKDDFFSPSDVTVGAGTTIIWQNAGTTPHTSTSDDGIWDSGIVDSGNSWSWTVPVDAPLGTSFPYYCLFHGDRGGQGMAGVIRVAADSTPPPPPPGADSVVVSMKDNFFEVRDITIRPGTKVIWQNVGKKRHTSTSDDGIWDSGTVDPGSSWSWTVPTNTQSGTSFPYYCVFHGGRGGKGMAGTILVDSAAPPPAPPAGSVAVTAPG